MYESELRLSGRCAHLGRGLEEVVGLSMGHDHAPLTQRRGIRLKRQGKGSRFTWKAFYSWQPDHVEILYLEKLLLDRF